MANMTKPAGRSDNRKWRASRAAAIAAAGGHCQLCGGPLVPGALRNSPAETCVDHIVPLYLGGDPYSLANLRAAHRRCNGSRPRRINGVVVPQAAAANIVSAQPQPRYTSPLPAHPGPCTGECHLACMFACNSSGRCRCGIHTDRW